jgi:hypothetical protein
MHPPIRIELPDDTHAAALSRLLPASDVETVAVDGHVEVRVGLLDSNPDRRVVDTLNAVDLWLRAGGLSSVRVHLDGGSYTLHAPPLAAQGD